MKPNATIAKRPIPEIRSGRKALYPFAVLKKGESFITKQSATNMRGVCGYWARKTGHRYKVRSLEDGTTCVWRVK